MLAVAPGLRLVLLLLLAIAVHSIVGFTNLLGGSDDSVAETHDLVSLTERPLLTIIPEHKHYELFHCTQ